MNDECGQEWNEVGGVESIENLVRRLGQTPNQGQDVLRQREDDLRRDGGRAGRGGGRSCRSGNERLDGRGDLGEGGNEYRRRCIAEGQATKQRSGKRSDRSRASSHVCIALGSTSRPNGSSGGGGAQHPTPQTLRNQTTPDTVRRKGMIASGAVAVWHSEESTPPRIQAADPSNFAFIAGVFQPSPCCFLCH